MNRRGASNSVTRSERTHLAGYYKNLHDSPFHAVSLASFISQITPVLAAHLEQGVGDLPERAAAHCVHEHLNVLSFLIAACLRLSMPPLPARIARLKFVQARELRLLLRLARACQLDLGTASVRVAERVDADDGIGSVVLLVLVDTATRPESCRAGSRSPWRRARRRARRCASNSFSTASSTRSVSSSMMKLPWLGFSFFARPHSRLMMSWIAMARRTLSSVGVVIASS